MQIAVDGPAGSGKSTISKIIAEKNNLVYLDTGAMYRAIAWLGLRCGTGVSEILRDVAGTVHFIFTENGRHLSIEYMCNGENHRSDVTAAIRGTEVTENVSAVAADGVIRKILTRRQQEIASGTDVIMDGRDIGTFVLPDADLKFFLTATPEERAKRRALEWGISPESPEYFQILDDIKKRDEADSTRKVSPLKKAADAIEIDTTLLTLDEVIAIIDVAVKKYLAAEA